MTLKETVIEFLTTFEDVPRDMFHEEYAQNYRDDESSRFLAERKIKTESVEHYGGEDQGSDYYTVYAFMDGKETVYVKFYGWYASHYGTEYQDYKFVKAKEKTITVYENE